MISCWIILEILLHLLLWTGTRTELMQNFYWCLVLLYCKWRLRTVGNMNAVFPPSLSPSLPPSLPPFTSPRLHPFDSRFSHYIESMNQYYLLFACMKFLAQWSWLEISEFKSTEVKNGFSAIWCWSIARNRSNSQPEVINWWCFHVFMGIGRQGISEKQQNSCQAFAHGSSTLWGGWWVLCSLNRKMILTLRMHC